MNRRDRRKLARNAVKRRGEDSKKASAQQVQEARKRVQDMLRQEAGRGDED